VNKCCVCGKEKPFTELEQLETTDEYICLTCLDIDEF